MISSVGYGTTAKIFHWSVVAALFVQYPLGWLMPDIERGMQPGTAMNTHISVGLTVLALIVLRLAWRITHPVAPALGLPQWQRLGSEAVHWLLYLLVLVTTLTGWTFASAHGWPLAFFGIFPIPGLVPAGSSIGDMVGELHGTLIYVLIAFIGLHAVAALAHGLIFRDGILRRMLPKALA